MDQSDDRPGGPQGLGRSVWELAREVGAARLVSELETSRVSQGQEVEDPRDNPEAAGWVYLLHPGNGAVELYLSARVGVGYPGAVEGRALVFVGRVLLSSSPDWEAVELRALAERQRIERAQAVAS